jgi:hypothetical protein
MGRVTLTHKEMEHLPGGKKKSSHFSRKIPSKYESRECVLKLEIFINVLNVIHSKNMR